MRNPISVMALRPGHLIMHDGSEELRKGIRVRSINDPAPLNGSHIIVNGSMTFHKEWVVGVEK